MFLAAAFSCFDNSCRTVGAAERRKVCENRACQPRFSWDRLHPLGHSVHPACPIWVGSMLVPNRARNLTAPTHSTHDHWWHTAALVSSSMGQAGGPHVVCARPARGRGERSGPRNSSRVVLLHSWWMPSAASLSFWAEGRCDCRERQPKTILMGALF